MINFPLIFFLFSLCSSSKINSLYQKSFNELLPRIVKDQFNFEKLAGFCTSDQRTAISVVSAFLTKHFMSYDAQKFKIELRDLKNYPFLDQILLSRPIKLLSEEEISVYKEKHKREFFNEMGFQILMEMSLLDEFCMFGLFEVLGRSMNPLVPDIRRAMKMAMRQSLSSKIQTTILKSLVVRLRLLCHFSDLNVLGSNLVHYILKSPNFDKQRTLEILNLRETKNLETFSEIILNIFGIQVQCDELFIKEPFEKISNILDPRISVQAEFSGIASGQHLLAVLCWPTSKLIAFAITLEKAIIVYAIILLRTKLGVKIEGGESNELVSQIKTILDSKTLFLTVVINMKIISTSYSQEVITSILEDTVFREFDARSVAQISMKMPFIANQEYTLIAKLYLFLEYFLFYSGAINYFQIAKLGFYSLLTNTIFESKVAIEDIDNYAIELLLVADIRKNFQWVFEKFFQTKKFGNLSTIKLIMKSLTYLPEYWVHFLIDRFNFDKVFTSISAYIEAPYQEMILEKMKAPYRKMGFNLDPKLLIETTPEPKILCQNPEISIRPLFYHHDQRILNALEKFCIDSEGKVQINQGQGEISLSMENNVQAFFQNTEVILATKTQRRPYFLIIIPHDPQISFSFTHLQIQMLLLLYGCAKLSTFFNHINLYQGAIFVIE
jgi:hypothetical protein